MNEKLTREKYNFDSNKIFSKLGFIHTHTHTHILPRFIYIGLLVFYTKLTHLAQKLIKKED